MQDSSYKCNFMVGELRDKDSFSVKKFNFYPEQLFRISSTRLVS